MTGQRFAFEPFASLDGVLRGEPIRIMPAGTFYRGERKLNITEERLKAIAANFKAGLPRFRVPINENHAGVGKVGQVNGLEYMPAGQDGPGLYATKYELTDDGRKLVESKRFDATSPEIIWTLLGGAKYQDPQTGEYHDNVMVGLALTDKPYFGHDNVALFSAEGSAMDGEGDMPMMKKIKQMLTDMMALFKNVPDADKAIDAQDFAVWTVAFMNDLPDSAFLHIEPGGEKDEDGRTVPRSLRHFPYKDASGKVDLPHLRNALARISQSSLSAEVKQRVIAKARGIAEDAGIGVSEEASYEEDTMADDKKSVPTPTPSPETFTVKADEFAALKAKAAEVDALSEKFKALESQTSEAKAKADKFAADLATEKHGRRLDQLIEKFDAMVGIPEKAETLADKVLALEEKDAELAKFFSELIEKADKALVESELFSQKGSARQSESETFEAAVDKVLTDQFKGDVAQYSNAMDIVQRTRPELAREYVNRGRR